MRVILDTNVLVAAYISGDTLLVDGGSLTKWPAAVINDRSVRKFSRIRSGR